MKLGKNLLARLGAASTEPTRSTLPLARTPAEAHLYMDLHPCACGEANFARDSAVVEAGGDLASRYTGSCPGCGGERRFLFRVPDDPGESLRHAMSGGVVVGDGSQSELLDAGEWLFVADRYARIVPGKVAPGTEAARVARQQLATAEAAMGEVLAFVPSGADKVPRKAIRSERGQAVYDAEPGRFRRERLEVVRNTYRQILKELDDAEPSSGSR